MLKIGDTVHGHKVEDDEWYAATVIGVHEDEDSGKTLYDIKYSGFLEDEAYEYNKPVAEIGIAEEYEEEE